MTMKSTQVTQWLVCSFLALSINADARPSDRTAEIDRLMTALYERGQFNGSIIVAIGGKAIYRKAFGEADFQSHQRFTPSTLSCIASVSKQFTAMTIMMLAEENKVNYDDPVTKYVPELPQYANDITIRHLLTHTSGIPDVDDLGIDDSRLTIDEVLKTLLRQRSLPSKPGQRYRYSNTGYMLLSLIVERVSGQRYRDFLWQRILKPLGMMHTILYDGWPHPLKSAAVGYNQFGNISTGAGGMYSTVDDLLKWDQALYTEKLVRQSALATAFTPGVVKEGVSTYGFGWNVSDKEGHKSVWHTGNTAGFRAFIERRLTERITILMLTNKGNSKRLQIRDAIFNILAGKPYGLPQRSIADKIYEAINQKGIQAAVQMYESLRATNDGYYDFGESELNTLGYQLLGDHKTNEAVEIFKLNTTSYPTSSNAFDSLGEAYLKSGNKELATKNYQKAIELDPGNLHARNVLKNLE
jgi:CubicO group peptidase (beta-lactamase class C family)